MIKLRYNISFLSWIEMEINYIQFMQIIGYVMDYVLLGYLDDSLDNSSLKWCTFTMIVAY